MLGASIAHGPLPCEAHPERVHSEEVVPKVRPVLPGPHVAFENPQSARRTVVADIAGRHEVPFLERLFVKVAFYAFHLTLFRLVSMLRSPIRPFHSVSGSAFAFAKTGTLPIRPL
ncbi:hypothetical protein HMPREF1248_0841 [Coriobacteriaceae bacterium BV3Ac1]|nr:hypothetical protein HMPREF1248_0841 [Coriobacteriaceae bacterium BV3Ac1]